MAQVLSYADKNYQQSKAIYDVIAQCLEDIKYGRSSSVHNFDAIHGGTSWNKPIEEVKGVVLRFLGEEHFELTYSHWETATIEQLSRMKLDQDGRKFINEVVKQLKKRFKGYTGKSLKLKEVGKPQQSIEKGSRLQADTSYLLGSSRYGYGARPVGRYVVKDSCVYEFGASL